MPSESRIELRKKTTRLVNQLSKAQLLDLFGISRIADITGLDDIQMPVFTATRVLSNTLSIHSGKGINPLDARAGAICEAIELHASEQPSDDAFVASAVQVPYDDRIDLSDCFPARASIVNDLTPIAWEEAINVQNGAPKLIPSDLIWMVPRIKDQPLMHFQSGSNGLASGATLEDAILSGLYEVIERDAWTISHYLLENFGIFPERTPLVGLPDYLESIVRRVEDAKLKLYLFDCTTDYSVPVFSAMLLDLGGQCAGIFAGYGCNLNAETAALRAVTEAAQGRACYISGARDDLLRRQFLLMKKINQVTLNAMFAKLPLGSPLSQYRRLNFDDVKTELRYLLKLIKSFGVSDVYAKELGTFLDGALYVARVFSPQCEPHRFDFWTPTLRCTSYCQRKIKQLAGEPTHGC